MNGAGDDRLQARVDGVVVLVEVNAEIGVGIARDFNAIAAGQDEINQLANLVDIGLPADASQGDFVAFEEDGVAPVDHLEFVALAIPKQMFGVDIVVDDVEVVRGAQEVNQSVEDFQHFQLGQALMPASQPDNFIFDDHAFRAFHDDVLLGDAADEELPAAQEFG